MYPTVSQLSRTSTLKMIILKKLFYRWKYRNGEPEMVKYWKTGDSVRAKVTLAPEGHYIMKMEGEKYPFPGYPRGTLLFGKLSPLKHNIKNLIFNDTWAKLRENIDENAIIHGLKHDSLEKIFKLAEETKFDMVPFDKMVPPVKEIWRAMSEVEKKVPQKTAQRVKKLKEIITFILQEDDAYRMRLQFVSQFFNPNSWWRRLTRRSVLKDFEYALTLLQHAEIVGDMKERILLFRTILLFVLKDQGVRHCFDLLCKEMDWKKLKLTKADKYFFRAKYFKADYPYWEY